MVEEDIKSALEEEVYLTLVKEDRESDFGKWDQGGN